MLEKFLGTSTGTMEARKTDELIKVLDLVPATIVILCSCEASA